MGGVIYLYGWGDLFPGVHCNVDIDECQSNPCDPAGTTNCVDKVDSYECDCKTGYTGKDCSVSAGI